MKNQIPILAIVIMAILWPFSIVQAQYAIPSFDIELTVANTSFEEDESFMQTQNMEERQMVVEVEDDYPAQTTWAVVKIYSLDEQDELGPYTVYEGTDLRVTIDQREWGVEVLDFLTGCIISTWIE